MDLTTLLLELALISTEPLFKKNQKYRGSSTIFIFISKQYHCIF